MEFMELPSGMTELMEAMEEARQAIDKVMGIPLIVGIDPAKLDADRTALLCGLGPDIVIIDECHLTNFDLDVSNELAGERRWFPVGDQEISGTFKADITAEQLLVLIQGNIEKSSEPSIDHRPKTDQFNPHLTKAELIEAEFPNRRQRRAQAAKKRRKH